MSESHLKPVLTTGLVSSHIGYLPTRGVFAPPLSLIFKSLLKINKALNTFRCTCLYWSVVHLYFSACSFEEEISSTHPPGTIPGEASAMRMIIGSNTYNQVAAQLSKDDVPGSGTSSSTTLNIPLSGWLHK